MPPKIKLQPSGSAITDQVRVEKGLLSKISESMAVAGFSTRQRSLWLGEGIIALAKEAATDRDSVLEAIRDAEPARLRSVPIMVVFRDDAARALRELLSVLGETEATAEGKRLIRQIIYTAIGVQLLRY